MKKITLIVLVLVLVTSCITFTACDPYNDEIKSVYDKIEYALIGKLNDGQFDECELTFRDLDQIAVAFARVINGIYHKRVEYPPQANLIAELKADEAKVLEAKAEQENMDNGALKEPEQKEGQE